MIENTYIEELINSCHTTWVRNIGVAIDPYNRGRESDGTFKADDKSTPYINEAWISGKSPGEPLRRILSKKKKVKKLND